MKKLVLVLFLSFFFIKVNAQCIAHAGPDTSICLGASAQIGAIPAATGSGAPFSYSWSPVAGLSCTNCPNPVVTPTVNATYTLTVTGSGGCNDTEQMIVTIDPVPTANFTFASNNICANLPINFTSTSSGVGLSYSWNFGDPTSGANNTSTISNPSHLFQAFGTGNQVFTVTLVVTNTAGCSASITQNVTVKRTPNPLLIDINNNFKNCGGGNFDILVYDGTSTSAISNYTIQWGDLSANYSAGSFPAGGVSHQYTTDNIFTLNYILTGTNGCVDTTSYNVANITNPSIGAANPGGTTGCGPLTLCFPLSNYSANHYTTYYEVNFGDGSPIITLPHPPPATICHTYTQTSCGQGGNQFVFRINAVNLCDSSNASISPIRVYTSPVANFEPSAVNNCVNSAVTFLNSSTTGFNSACSGAALFQWDFGNGQTLTSPTLTNPTSVYTLPGTYTISLSVTNGCGTSTITKTVCIEIPPVPDFTITPNTGCSPLNTVITNTSVTANTCLVSRVWSVIYNGSPCSPASGNFSFTGGTDASSLNPQIQFTGAGNYTVRLTLTNSCGSFFIDKPVIVQGPPQLSINPLGNACASATVSPSAIVNDCLEPADSYAWTFPGGTPATSSSLIPGTVSFSTSGLVTISLAVTNACGTASANTNFNIIPLPPVLNPTANSPLCVGQTANFTSTTVAGVLFSWSGPNFFSSNAQNPTITNVSALNAGTYSVFGTLNGCVGPTSTTNLVINPMPIVSVVPANASICNGASVNLTASGATSYTWSPALGLNATTGAIVTASPIISTTYSVTGFNGTCSGTTSVPITVNPKPIVNAGPDQTLCNQAIPILLTGTPAGGTWTGAGGITAGGSFTPSTAGTFQEIYSFTDVNGCTNTDTLLLNVIAPTIANAGADFSTCLNTASINLLGIPAGGTWSGTNISAGGSFSPLTVGSFNLVYTFGVGTCQTTDTLIATVFPLPLVDAGNPVSYCITNPVVNLVGSPVGGTWTGTGITNPTGIFTPSTAGVGTHVLSYTFTNGNGCINTDNVSLTVNPLPIVNAGVDTTLCNQPFPIQLTASPIGGTWSGTNVSTLGVFTPTGIGSFTLTYSFTNVNGCTNTDVRVITVINPTQPNAGADFTRCIDAANVVLVAAPIGGTWSGTTVTTAGVFDPTTVGVATVVYTFGAGNCLLRDTLLVTVNPLPIVDAGNPAAYCISVATVSLVGSPVGGTWTGTGITNSTGIFTPSTAGIGTHLLTYSFTDANGCTNSDNVSLTVNPLPIVNAGIDTSLCNLPIPVTLNAIPLGGTWSGTNVSTIGVFTPAGVGSFTLTYSFTNGNGCSNTDSRVVTVVNPVISNAGPNLVACLDAPNVTLAGSPLTGTWTGSFVTVGGVFNPTIAGVFPLVISNGVGNCLTRDTMQFTVNALPVVNAGANVGFCPSDAAVNFNGLPIGGTWSGTGITNASLGTFNPSIPSPGAYNEIYTFTSPTTGCINRDTLIATIHPFPTANFTYNPIACLGVSETFTNTTINGSTYAWNFGDLGTSAAVSPSHTYSSAGFFTIQLIATSPFGCLDSIQHIIEVRVPPVADFTLAPDSACGPIIVVFTDLSTGPNLTYNWNFGNGQNSAIPSPGNQTYVAGIVADTSYVVTLTLTNFCGTSIHKDTVIAMPKPTAIFGTNVNIGCSPLNLQMVNNSLGLPDTYSWDFGNGVTSSSSAATLQQVFTTGVNDTTFTIQLIVENECGIDTTTHQITVLPNQVNAFFNTDNPSGCVPHTVNFTQFSQGATFSSWDFGDGNTSGTLSPTHTFTTAGTFTVTLFANDGCGYDTITTIITVFPSPTVSFSSTPDSVCINELFSFTNTSLGLAAVLWNFGDGNTSNLTNPTHAYLISGTYPVTLSGTSLVNGCSASLTQNIVVSTNPVASFNPTPILGCLPLVVSMNNSSTNSSFQAWNFGDGNSSAAFSPTHTYTTAGSFVIRLYVENANGCSDSISQIVTVYPLPTADFDVATTNACSQPLVATFTNQSTGAINYEWNFGDGQISSLTNPVHSYNATGNYNVSLIVSTIYGCKDTATAIVNSYPQAVANFTLPNDSICQNEAVVFVSTSSFADSLQWNFGNGNLLIGNTVSYAFPQTGIYTIELIAFGQGGCNDTVSLNTQIVIMPSPVADFSFVNIQNTDPLSGTVEFTNLSSGGTIYDWSFGNGNTSTEENPIERYNSFGDFNAELIVTSDFGCMDTIVKVVDVDFFYGLFIPNAMNPGHSEFGVANFIPKGVGLKTFELLIYDDWGNLIWSTNALDADGRPTEYWDGTYKGEAVQQDAYVWKATATFLNDKVWEGKEYPNGRLKRAGSITIVR